MQSLISPERLMLAPLVCLLLVAIWYDARTRRIPNRLVLTGALGALALHLLDHFQDGSGLGGGLLFSVAGFAVGLLLLLPLYALRAMGAGDVKLMAMVGAFIGPLEVIGAALLTMLVGGLMSLLLAIRSKQLGRVMSNVRHILWGATLGNTFRHDGASKGSSFVSGKFPYAAAIGAGTVLQLALAGTPAWRLFS